MTQDLIHRIQEINSKEPTAINWFLNRYQGEAIGIGDGYILRLKVDHKAGTVSVEEAGVGPWDQWLTDRKIGERHE